MSRSVNMVSGNKWPTGDPYLQRQNEPSVAVSTRNPLHLLAGANDYRTVDMPGLPSETGDAWLGIFKSVDGGDRWETNLLPGYPQDTSAEGLASPLRGFQAGADPVVRPGTNGLLYYAGLAFNRGENQPSAVFMSRFIDNNNTENGDPIRYLGTSIIDKSTGADFIDKPWMAVDVPRAGAKVCRIVVSQPPADEVKPGVGWGRYSGWKKNEEKKREREREDSKKGKKPQPKSNKDPRMVAQSIEAGRIYVAYSRIKTVGTATESKIMFSQSDDCGVTWSRPVQLSNPADKVNQGANIAIDPKTGAVYVAWRQFGLTATDTDSVMVARMSATSKGFDTANRVRKFNAHRPGERLRRMIAEHRSGDADEVSEIQPFDQGTAEDRFRTNAYPTMAIDDEGRAYVAWTERGFGRARPNSIDPASRQVMADGDARVVISTSRNGAAWTAPQAVDAGNGATPGTPGGDMPGHQLMPSISFAAGKLVVVYYDLREDVSRVFGPYISERDAVNTVRRRHTIDIRAAYALKGDAPVFGPSQQVSSYLQGNLRGSTEVGPLQANAPGLPLFKLGTVPFLGDYIDIAPSPAFVQNAKGVWGYNTTAQASPVFHVVWTDNRDVQKPADGNWTNYTPVGAATDPGRYADAPACVPGQAGMRNQNIYSARLTWGLVAGSPGNSKTLDPNTPRAFVVFAQNTTTTTRTFRFSIGSQPIGGVASFSQTRDAGAVYPLLSVDVSVAPRSMVTRTVYVTSTDPKAQVPVDVREVSAPSAPIISGGLASRVLLNPDISNPDISNPDISNPDISNPDISNAEVYNPDISNPDISNPDISNPDISNPDISNPDISNIVIANPDISNPDISNPDISNPDISNPDISNPDISNPDISNGAITDVTWTIVNTGNTTTSFNVNLFLAGATAKLAGPGGTGVQGGIKTQLVVHKTYTTPVAVACDLKQQAHTVLVANVPYPTFYEPGTTPVFDPTNPDVTNTTLWLEPGGEGKITLRIVDPNPRDGITVDPVRDVTPVVTALPKNTPDLGTPAVPPPSTTPPAVPDVTLAFTAQPTDTAVNGTIAPISVHAQVGANPGANVQVTLAIAINPAGGHLSGTVTLLTDAAGNATFTGLSIEKAGIGYRLSASAAAAGAVPAQSAPFNIGGIAPPSPYIVTNTNDSGAGSFRDALIASNTDPSMKTISFAIPGTGPFTIAVAPANPLPSIVQPVTIDGTTQPGYDGRPMVRIDGTGTATRGLEFDIAGTVKGLSITGFTSSAGVLVTAGVGTVVQANHIGTDRTGTTAFANNIGVQLNGVASSVVRDNVLSGNSFSGVIVTGGSSNEIRNNKIGTTVDGLAALPNGDNGITLFDGSSLTTIDGNLISGNGGIGNGWGIDMQQSGALASVVTTTVTNNVIGLDINGNFLTHPVGPSQGNKGGGIRLQRAYSTVIGGVGNGNVISGNGGAGIRVEGPLGGFVTTIVDNKIGSDPTGTLGRGNAAEGVSVDTTASNVTMLSNVIFNNGLLGITLNGAANGSMVAPGLSVQAVQSIAGHTLVDVNQSSAPGAYTFEFFSGTSCGRAQQMVTSTVGTAGAQTIELGVGLAVGTWVTATATDAAGNTSQLAACTQVPPIVTGGTITSVSPAGQLSAGGGQMLWIRGTGMQGLSAADVLFSSNGSGETAAQYVWGITPTLAIARPLHVAAGGPAPGPGYVRIKNPAGTVTTANYPVLFSTVPGTPIAVDIHNACGINASVNSGLQGSTISVHAEGVDTSGASLIWSGPGGTVIQTVLSTTGGIPGTVAECTTVPNLTPGLYSVQVRTSSGWYSTDSAPSNILNFTIFGTPSITSVTPVNGAPGEGFIAVRGSNIPATLGDTVAEVTTGVTTQTGFVYPSPTTPSVAYVRLPFGQPLGPSTITIKNLAGTLVSNAFPITLTATPGTPVITEIRDSGAALVAGPVGAGTMIHVGVDGADTTGAVVRFTQGANTWDLTNGVGASNNIIGFTLQVNVPGDASTGPINISVRQGASAFSTPVTISVSNPGYIGTAGGPGGNPFGPVTCPVGSVLTALTGEAGSYIGQFTMWCSPVLPGPSLGAAVASAVIGIPGVGPVNFGAALTCPAGSMITGIHGTAGNVGWGVIVEGLAVDCKDVATAAPYSSAPVGGSFTTPFNFACPAGDEAIGFAGAFGSNLDRIGIVCANRAAPAPLPTGAPNALSGYEDITAVMSLEDVQAAWFDPRRRLR